MTISATARRAGPFLGNDSATAFAFTFKVFSTSDITVTTADSAAVETTLVLDTDYTVTLNPNQDTSPGGVVTYPISGSALPTGARLTITGNLPYDQPLDIPAGGNFNPVTIENEFDRIVMQVQQLREVADRSITASVTSSVSGELPVPQAGRLLGWDQSNTAIINYSIEELTGTAAYATWVYDTFTGNGIKRVYALQKSPGNIANCDVSVDGQTLVPITDFTVSGSTLTFVTAPRSGAEILVRYGSAAPQGTYAIETERKVATAGQTVVTLTEVTYVPGANNISVYVNGVRMSAGIDFTETSSTSITFESALSLNDEIVCVVGSEITSAMDSANVGFLQSGTGAVSRTVRSKLRDTVSVKDFGAVGDGVTDDTAAINTAIAQLNAGAAKALRFPAGVYVISSALTPITLSGVSLLGEGSRQSVIHQTTNNSTFWFKSTSPSTTDLGDVYISALGINQTISSPTAGVALQLTRVTRGYFSDLDIRNVFGGIVIESGNDLHFDSLTVSGAYTWTSLATGSNLLAIRAYTGTTLVPSEIFFSNFNIRGAGPSPMHLATCITIETGDGIWFDTGHLGFSYNAPLFINPQNNAALSLENIEFANVYIDGNLAGNTSSSGVYLAGSTTPTVRSLKFDGCVIKNFNGGGAFFDLSTLRDLRITDSLIADNGTYGLIINGSDEVILADNTFRGNNKNAGANNAIELSAVSVGTITGNMVLAGANAHTTGLKCDSASSDLVVSNNVFQGHTTDMNFTGSSRVTFKGNRKSGSDPTVVAADGFTLPFGYDVVEVTGNTNFSNITSPSIANYVVTLKFTGTPTVFDSAGNIKLAGNFVATADSTLTLMNTGATWTEVARAVV